MKICVFAGTFDPIQKGHKYVIDKCLEIFDKVIVAVGVNVNKKPLFSLEERLEIIKRVYDGNDRVEVDCFDGMLVDFMREKGVTVTVRGLRNQDDYKYETTMANYNKDLDSKITTLFIPTPADLSYVSSSGVRNIIELDADFSSYVPENVKEYITQLIKAKA